MAAISRAVGFGASNYQTVYSEKRELYVLSASRLGFNHVRSASVFRASRRVDQLMPRKRLNDDSRRSLPGVAFNCQNTYLGASTALDEPFAVTLERGFLPVTDPSCSNSLFLSPSLHGLPEFRLWEEMAADIPVILSACSGEIVRKKIELLPRFPDEELLRNGTKTEIWRAMLIISFIAHTYVWCGETPANKLPDDMAISWCAIADSLDVPPVLAYASYALLNWRRIDPTQPIELDNIVSCYNFYGGIDEEWFRVVHVDIEARAGPALEGILKAQDAVSQNNVEKVRENLVCMSQALQLMYKSLDRMGEKCDPYIFYHRVRRFIYGWRNNPALPDGLLYGEIRKLLYGETGAQSSIVPTFDAALGVVHPSGHFSDYLQAMRLHMPAPHRQFVKQVQAGTSIRNFVLANLADLGEAYDECLVDLFKFRTLHKKHAHEYIRKPSNEADGIGTGGSEYTVYLQHNAVTTKGHLIGVV